MVSWYKKRPFSKRMVFIRHCFGRHSGRWRIFGYQHFQRKPKVHHTLSTVLGATCTQSWDLMGQFNGQLFHLKTTTITTTIFKGLACVARIHYQKKRKINVCSLTAFCPPPAAALNTSCTSLNGNMVSTSLRGLPSPLKHVITKRSSS